MKANQDRKQPSLVALLRGINVGGHTVKMKDLKEAFESLGCENVKTVLASGNVLFDVPDASNENTDTLARRLEAGLKERFGFAIPVLLRTRADLERLAESEPFKGIEVTPDTRLYVTFLSSAPQSELPLPYTSPDGNFTILSATESEVCSVLTVVKGGRTIDLMGIVEKEYGSNVTTRNWNTVKRLLG
jgi:uncharacterized protein (DUF1697 family)